ncbi:MAG: riboflavin kinase [Hydrogeniiclostridium mannosilyticum]
MDFQVIHGRRLGRRLGFPTINQVFPDGFLLPRFGVYASVTELNGAAYYGVTNIGVKPTVGADRPLSETWLPGYRGPEVYGERPAVEILEFIRPERKFDSLESLRAQIFQDGETARKIVYKARSV